MVVLVNEIGSARFTLVLTYGEDDAKTKPMDVKCSLTSLSYEPLLISTSLLCQVLCPPKIFQQLIPFSHAQRPLSLCSSNRT